MRVLVTGGAGYLGSVLCEHLLDAGHEVTVLDCLLYGEPSLFHLCHSDRFSFVRGDVRDEDLMRDLVASAEVVMPLAAIVGATGCDRDPLLATSVNLDSVCLLNRLRSADQLVILPVTNSGYGTKSGETHCTEETPLEPISLYGQTKVQAEAELLSKGPTITLRLATVFGMSPRMRLDLLVNHFTYAAVTDGYIVIFEKDFKRNFVHVRDVADCFLYAMDHADAMAGKAYNVGLDDANLSKEELALAVKQQVPGFYIHFSEIGSDPDKRNYIVSNQRLREAGFEASRSIKVGILELVKGFSTMPRGMFKNS